MQIHSYARSLIYYEGRALVLCSLNLAEGRPAEGRPAEGLRKVGP